MSLIPQLTDAGKGLLISALSGSPLTFSKIKIGNGAAPDDPASGDYWFDTDNRVLNRYSEQWNESTRPITVAEEAPESPSDGDLWYNTDTEVLYYYGDGWKVNQTTITCSTTAPESSQQGDYWYDTANEILYAYGNKWNSESDVTILCAQSAPASPTAGDYWYDQANTKLKVCTLLWGVKTNVTLACSDSAPTDPSTDDYWYDTDNSVLKKYSGTEWETDTHAFSYATTAPADPESGDWWYDMANSLLKEYSLGWADDTTHTFNYGMTAPATPNAGDWWYDTTLHVYGTGWVPDNERPFTYGSAAPTTITGGDWWFDTANSVLYAYGKLWLRDTGDTFTYAATAPARAYDFDLWYDTIESQLKEYATGWMQDAQKVFSYSSVAPITPNAGDWWYNTDENALYEYTGAQWNRNYTTISCGVSAPATQDALTDLVNPILNISITDLAKGSNYVSITGNFDNSEVTSGFNWAETGIFAKDADGKELLYAYCHTGDEYEYIPANGCGKTIGVNLTLLVMVGDAETVNAVIGEGTLYATKEDLESHKRDFKNPHGVSAEQIGLGNVQNVSASDAIVEYTEASALEEPAPGEKASIFYGKVKKAINNLILHLKANNPHSITPEKIKAAAENHSHKASDINEGILGVARGGTGVASTQELANLMGSYFKVPVFGVYTGNGAVKRLISLEFTPSAVFVCNGRGMVGDDIDGVCGGLCVGTYGLRTRSCTAASHETSWSNTHTAMMITANGFFVNYDSSNKIATNKSGETYRYIAFR